MKTMMLLTASWLVMGYQLLAQKPLQFTVHQGETVTQTIPRQERYRFDAFQEGSITYGRGTIPALKLNYSPLLGEMLFIRQSGDTAILENEPSLQRVVLGETVFYSDYREGYFEVLAAYPAVKLGVKQQFIAVRSDEVASNGYITTSNPTTRTVSVIQTNTDQKGLADIVFEKKHTYVLIDRNNRIHKCRKSSVLALWPGYKNAIQAYLLEKPVNFQQEEDLKRLLTFCSQLDQENAQN